MPEVTVWRLPVAALGSVLELSVVTTITFPHKAFVAAIGGVDNESFVEKNRRWAISEGLGQPFMYLPETTEPGASVNLGPINIPTDAAEVALSIRPWAGSRQWPSRAFEALQVSRRLPSGRALTTYLEGDLLP
jgi:hypothetical protein